MKLTIKRYSIMLSLQTVLFITDFLINIFSTLVRQHNGISLILFIVQSACLVLSLGTLFLTFFSTYAFQAGLIDLLYEKFHISLIVFLFYFIITILLQIWFIIAQWNSTTSTLIWSTPLFLLFIIQRTLTPIYYYYYKRATLRISDPRFYEDVWMNDSRIETIN